MRKAIAISLTLLATGASAQDGSWNYYGDLRLRAERTQDIPARSDDIERLRSFLRAGARYSNDSGFEFAAAGKLGLGSDDNDDNVRNLDNERSDSGSIDELYVAWQASESTRVQLGKARNPFVTTALTWDRDLRPIGASIEYQRSVRDFDAFYFTGGYFAGDHLYSDDSKFAGLQIGYGWMEGAETGFSTFLGYFDYSDLETAARNGLGRTNRRTGGLFVSDFDLLNWQLTGRTPLAEKPLVARIDLVRNLGADDQRDGARFSAVWGDAEGIGGWELGYSYQRPQRDAVLAYFAEDDWWFHSFARGYMPWVAYGFERGISLQLSAFVERRDGIDEETTRLLFDVRKRW